MQKPVLPHEDLDVPPPPPPGGERTPREHKAEADDLEHLLQHDGYNKYCDGCRHAKLKRRPARRGAFTGKNPDTRPTEFGELGNADYIVAQSEESMGLTGEKDALVVYDVGGDFEDCFPLMTRHNSEAYGALQEFYGAEKPKRIYTDNAPELIRACKDLGYNHDKSTPYRHESNATCERRVRSIVEGARALLEKAGLPSCFWIFAVRHDCLMHNSRTPTNGDSPWM